MRRIRNAWGVLRGTLDADYQQLRQEQIAEALAVTRLAALVARLEKRVARLETPPPRDPDFRPRVTITPAS